MSFIFGGGGLCAVSHRRYASCRCKITSSRIDKFQLFTLQTNKFTIFVIAYSDNKPTIKPTNNNYENHDYFTLPARCFVLAKG